MLNALQRIDFMTQRNYRTSTVKPSRVYIKSINKGFVRVYVSLVLVCFTKKQIAIKWTWMTEKPRVEKGALEHVARKLKSHLSDCVWCYFDSFDNFSWFDIIIVIEVKEKSCENLMD